jgi:hypothetical protein
MYGWKSSKDLRRHFHPAIDGLTSFTLLCGRTRGAVVSHLRLWVKWRMGRTARITSTVLDAWLRRTLPVAAIAISQSHDWSQKIVKTRNDVATDPRRAATRSYRSQGQHKNKIRQYNDISRLIEIIGNKATQRTTPTGVAIIIGLANN